MSEKSKLSPFRAARRASVPLLFLETADPAASMRRCASELNGEQESIPILRWDCVNGLVGANEPGKELASTIADPQEPGMLTNPTELLSMLAGKASKLCVTVNGKKRGAVVNLIHLNRFMDNPGVVQGLWNCRDALKSYGVSLVALGPAFTVPAELKNDIVVISEALPGPQEISAIVDSVCADAGLSADKIEDRGRVVDTLTGVSAFGAEQVLAMSLNKDGIDGDQLWERKRKMIEQTPGLSVWKGGSSFDDLGGLSNLKDFLRRVLTSGKTVVRAIGFIDEIEKGLAGSAGDTSGTSQDQLQVFLKVMQDLAIPGIILLGHPGCGKSEIGKATGNLCGGPVVAIDTGAMKGSLVGQSEERIRSAMEVFRAVSNGQGLFIATCNKIQSLPPELRRRFSLGTFFVDLPDAEERASIWRIWRSRYNINTDDLPNSDGWTGAEIKACCDVAFRTGLSLREASAYVVPVIKSAPEQVEALRKLAHNRFISASTPGIYKMPATDQPINTGRKMEL